MWKFGIVFFCCVPTEICKTLKSEPYISTRFVILCVSVVWSWWFNFILVCPRWFQTSLLLISYANAQRLNLCFCNITSIIEISCPVCLFLRYTLVYWINKTAVWILLGFMCGLSRKYKIKPVGSFLNHMWLAVWAVWNERNIKSRFAQSVQVWKTGLAVRNVADIGWVSIIFWVIIIRITTLVAHVGVFSFDLHSPLKAHYTCDDTEPDLCHPSRKMQATRQLVHQHRWFTVPAAMTAALKWII